MGTLLGVTKGLDGVALLKFESRRREAGDAGAEPTAPEARSQEFFPDSGSEVVGESKMPGDSKTTGTCEKCSVGILI